MKWMIASDIHGSAYYCRKLTEAFQREAPDKILLLGDLLYHGPRNDLPRDYAPKQVIEMLSALDGRVLCVRGNCDSEVDQMVLPFPILAEYCIIEEKNTMIFASHGHHFSPEQPPHFAGRFILLGGHTHIGGFWDYGDFIAVNPGSVSIPKGDGGEHSYLTLENGVFTLKALDGNELNRLIF